VLAGKKTKREFGTAQDWGAAGNLPHDPNSSLPGNVTSYAKTHNCCYQLFMQIENHDCDLHK
jgi:hypothetical protein